MSRSVAYLILGAFLLGSAADAEAAEGKRPNILFAFADDWGRHASAYAKLDGPGTVNDVLQTPNFDRVAGEGVLFRRAFVSAPSCTPCRSALFSGQHFWRTGRGAILRGAVWDGTNLAWPLMLRDAGYHIGETLQGVGPGHAGRRALRRGQARLREGAAGTSTTSRRTSPGWSPKARRVEAAKKKLYDEVLANFNAFLADRKPGQPFCYWFGPTNVHRKWVKGSGKKLWNIEPDALKGKMPPFLADVPEIREDLADYFGEVQAFDAALGVLLQRLEGNRRAGEHDHRRQRRPRRARLPARQVQPVRLRLERLAGRALGRGEGRAGRRRPRQPARPRADVSGSGRRARSRPHDRRGASLPVLTSEKSGQVDPQRTAVFIGRERHVENARADFMPYPQRAIRTHEFLYIINFKPDRWPLGDPYRLDGDNPPTAEEITQETRVTLPDDDAGPAKAWLVGQAQRPAVEAAVRAGLRQAAARGAVRPEGRPAPGEERRGGRQVRAGPRRVGKAPDGRAAPHRRPAPGGRRQVLRDPADGRARRRRAAGEEREENGATCPQLRSR